MFICDTARFFTAGSVCLSSQALAVCMMQQDNQVSHSE